jgi:RNA polymerase sigma factor (sigma-70 family)
MSVSDSARKPFTESQFAAGLETMRPGLIKFACRIRPCSPEDAEDLVQDAARIALLILERFDPERSALVDWMNGILKVVILRDRERKIGEPTTIPLIHALQVPSEPDGSLRLAMQPHIDRLPDKLANVVNDHLDGYSQAEIVQRRQIHRNTVANRLALAAQQLQCQFVDFEEEWDNGFFRSCCRHTIYHKPSSMATYWRHKGIEASKPAKAKRLRGAARRRAALANKTGMCVDNAMLDFEFL